jgi:L-fuconolactonase
MPESRVNHPMIDAHVHFWDPERLHYEWLERIPPLRRRRTPESLAHTRHAVSRWVFVQADCREEETWAEIEWVSELAGGIRSGASWPTPDCTGAPPRATRSSASPRTRSSWACAVTHAQLPALTDLVARCDAVTFVLDHLGKPDVAGGRLDPWRADLARLAKLPNVACKLSGLATEADPRGWTPADLRPYLDHALACFGPQRCLVGSDWPVVTLATTYDRWFDVVLDCLDDLGFEERRAVLSDNAVRVCGLAA